MASSDDDIPTAHDVSYFYCLAALVHRLKWKQMDIKEQTCIGI